MQGSNMDGGFGIERPRPHGHPAHASPAKYLVLIKAADETVARLFLDTRVAVAEFDAGAEEVALMTRGLVPTHAALGREWDDALAGHSAAERAAAQVFVLDV